jgi:hypothetical protein
MLIRNTGLGAAQVVAVLVTSAAWPAELSKEYLTGT